MISLEDTRDTVFERVEQEEIDRWSAGWIAADEGEAIPYETAFWAPHTATEDDIERARELADEDGWVGR